MTGSAASPPWPPDFADGLDGRYRLISQVGKGGMAAVFLAEDVKQARDVAIKVLLPELASTVGADRFLREVEVTAGLNHPNILPLLDSGTANGAPYYVMPLFKGETLNDRLDREPQLPLDEAVRITAQIGQALTHAHSKGVIHRDIKPANILFVEDQAVVADFGIAKALTAAGGEELTRTGLLVGTPQYMSPEQADPTSVIDGRSDLYSLGCVLYRMLVGEAPFTGPNSAAILARHAVDTVPPPSTVRSELPKAVDRVVEKALAKSPADRYGSVALFLDALAQASAVDIAQERARLRRVRTRVAALVAAVLAASTWYGLSRTSGANVHRLAVLPVTPAVDQDRGFLAQGVHSALIGELGQVGLTVVGRNSVLRYADGQTSTRVIGQELGVDGVIEATVVSTGDGRLSLNASLVDVATEAVQWAGLFAVEVEDLLHTVRMVADSVAVEVGLEVDRAVLARRLEVPKVDARAYELVLRGDELLGLLTPSGLDSAKALFEEALTIQPNLAEAHAGIAKAWGYRQQMGITPPYEAFPEARLAVREAVRLDSLNASIQAVLAVNEWHARNWEATDQAYRRALELDPGDARSRAFYAHYLTVVGRADESRTQVDSALALDPYDVLVQGLRAVNLLFLKENDAALAQAAEVAAVAPGHPLAMVVRRSVYAERGMLEEAYQAALAETHARRDEELAAALERGWQSGGYSDAMRAAAETLEARAELRYVAPSQVYELYFAAGMVDEAIEWLERGFDVREPQLPYLSVMPFVDGIRDDPRIERLMRRLEYPEPSASG